MSAMDDLRDWYCAQCDGDWEHQYGVVIETMDNPGWLVKIDLLDTILQNETFEAIEMGDSNEGATWIKCEIKVGQFHGMGDPSRLEEIISCFINWAKARPDWLGIPASQSG